MSTCTVDCGGLPDHTLGAAAAGQPTETDPLIPDARPRKKPFYRARPLWCVPHPVSVVLFIPYLQARALCRLRVPRGMYLLHAFLQLSIYVGRSTE